MATPNTRSMLFPIDKGTDPASINFVTASIRRPPSNVNIYVLTAGTAFNIPIPAGVEWALFNAFNTAGTAQIPYFICDAAIATAALPTANVTNGAGVEFCPSQYNVRLNSVSGLSAISNSAGFLTVSLYSPPSNNT